ncbi:hypothetical protein ABC382_00485 [Lysinibacillus sp. 1P01SD]|uniref:hypothetical protein n=1 Tax=Lysinibacillus sp. 1P01SD TaxID=3132285 RepID=UPI0039A19E22
MSKKDEIRNLKRVKIANAVKQIRVEKEIQQKEIANWLGISVSSYCMKERGNRPFLGEELEIIIDNLEIDSNRIYK